MPELTLENEPDHEWRAEVFIGILAGTEPEALAVATRSFDAVDIPLKRGITVSRHGVARWIACAEVDISELAMDPDNAETRLSYISGHFPDSIIWTSRISYSRGRLDWPPSFWDVHSAEDEFLLESSIRAVAISVRRDAAQFDLQLSL